MKKIFMLSALLVCSTGVNAGDLISCKTDSLIRTGIELCVEQNYDDAIAIFTELERSQPQSPAGYFFHAAALQSQMMDYEIYDRETEFLALVKTTIELSNSRIRKNGNDAWAYFFLGGGYGYLAFYQAKQKKFYEAFEKARFSIKALEKAVQIDSTLYDAHLGLGTYKYYRSKLSRHFTWLPFVKDERPEGIAMVRAAIHKSRYSRFSAISGFGWISIDEGRYDEGWQMLKPVLEEFPMCRAFQWCAAKLAKKQERWNDSIAFYEQILASLKMDGALSPYNELVLRKNLQQLYIQINDLQRAKEECEQIQKIAFGKEKRCEEILKEVKVVCDQQSHLHGALN